MKTVLLLLAAFTLPVSVEAELIVNVSEPKTASAKALVKLTVQNTFSEKVESARATMFLLNEQEKLVGQATQWIVGGTDEKPALASNASITYNFVIPTDKPFTKTKLIFNRIILEGGKQVDPAKNFEIIEK